MRELIHVWIYLRQYNVIELYSFFGFLRIRPYSKWEHWNEHIAKPIAKGHGGVRAMKQLQVSTITLALPIARLKEWCTL